jgi:hypothetical protein
VIDALQDTAPLDPIDIGLLSKTSWLPGLSLVATTALCFTVSVWVFKQKTIGGFAWIFPLLVASAVGLYLYRQVCLDDGVLTNKESLNIARMMSLWAALAVLLGYGWAQKSAADGFVSLLLAVPVWGVTLFGGIFAVKTFLLVQNYRERVQPDRVNINEIAAMQAEYRLHKGIKEVPTLRPVASPPSYEAPAERPFAFSPETKAQPSPADDDEIVRKRILEVRAQALKAQRKAEKSLRLNS